MQIPNDLKFILTNLEKQKLSQKEVKRLVFICRSIAAAAIKTYHNKAAQILYNYGWSLYDLSYDCIGELFSTDSEERLLKFDSFLQNLNPPLDHLSDNEIFFILKGYINKFVSYRLKKILKEEDPAGSKISRNIRDAAKDIKNLPYITWDFRGEVLNFSQNTLNEHLPEFPIKEFEAEFITKINVPDKIAEILNKICVIVSGQDFYRKSVRFNDVVQIIKRLYANIFSDELNNEIESQFNFNSNIEEDLEVLTNSITRHIAEKINATYYQKHKIEKTEASGLLYIITTILGDWIAGNGTDHNYFKYAEKNLHCSKEEYDERWASIIHYLVKMMRLYIKEQLEVE